jgi:uncharacterized protein DUF1573
MEMMASLSLPGPSTLGTLLAALLAPACEPDAPAAAGPLVTAEPRIDFGTVFEGRVLEHEWQLEVRAPVAVSAAKSDCGCTLARLELEGPGGSQAYELGTPLAAGQRLRVDVRYDTRGRRGPAARAVTLVHDGGEPFVLQLVADVQPWLSLEPAELAYTRVVLGEGAVREFRVRAVGGEAFGLQATGVALPPWVKVELAPVAPGADGRATGWSGSVRLGKDAPRGNYSYPIELVSDVAIPDGGERRFSISPAWTLQVVGVVALSSPTLEFGLVTGNEVASRSVRLESFDPAFAPSHVVARLEPIKAGEDLPLARTARLRTDTAGQECRIELTLDGLDAAVSGTFLARLVVETGHPALPRLEALVRGVRAPDGGGSPRKP